MGVDDEEEKNNRRKYKYDQFIKFMLKDGGAEVIIDGANVGHMIKQDCFSFDFVDNVATYYDKNGKKVRIIMAVYRIYNAENCRNERVQNIIKKWLEKKWLLKVPNILYDDVLWSIYALSSCLVYDGNVIIVTNDEMRDHAMKLNYKQKFTEFLETKLCRIQLFKEENAISYNPFEAVEIGKKRKLEFDDDFIAAKKQKLNDGEIVINARQSRPKYQYIHHVFPYKLHPPAPYVIKPQFYQYPIGKNGEFEQLVWFIPYISASADCKNQLNVLKQCYTEWILKKRVKWMVAKLKRPI